MGWKSLSWFVYNYVTDKSCKWLRNVQSHARKKPLFAGKSQLLFLFHFILVCYIYISFPWYATPSNVDVMQLPKTDICTSKSAKILQYPVSLHFYYAIIWEVFLWFDAPSLKIRIRICSVEWRSHGRHSHRLACLLASFTLARIACLLHFCVKTSRFDYSIWATLK